MRNGFKVIDADAHFYEPADLSPYSPKVLLDFYRSIRLSTVSLGPPFPLQLRNLGARGSDGVVADGNGLKGQSPHPIINRYQFRIGGIGNETIGGAFWSLPIRLVGERYLVKAYSSHPHGLDQKTSDLL